MTMREIELAAPTDKVRELAGSLGSVLRAEREERMKKMTDELKAALPQALREGMTAETVAALDAPMALLSRLIRIPEGGEGSVPAELRVLLQQGREVWEFLRGVQDLLAGVGDKDSSNVASRLESLFERGNLVELMPRSELLARLRTLKRTLAKGEVTDVSGAAPGQNAAAFQQRLDNVKILAEIAPLLREVKAAKLPERELSPLRTQISALEFLWKTYSDLQQGFAVNFPLSGYDSLSAGGSDSYLSLRYELFRLALPRVLGVAETQPAKEGEGVVAYLQRVKAGALSAQNWPLLSRVAETAEKLNLPSIASSMDSSALKSMFSGQNFERAQQYAQAVNAYHAALKTGSQLLPADEIGRRLVAIREQFPKDFEAGLQLTEAAIVRDPFGRPVYYGVPGRPYGPLGRNVPAVPGAARSLSVPAIPDPASVGASPPPPPPASPSAPPPAAPSASARKLPSP